MPTQRAKKTVKKAASSAAPSVEGNELQIEEKDLPLIDQEVERQISAIRAMRDMEIEHALTGLRLLRSNFTEEQLQTPVLQFFKENFPNLSIVNNAESGEYEVKYKNDNLCSNQNADGRDVHSTLLRHLSMAYSDHSAMPSLGGFDFCSDAVRTSILGAANLQIGDFNLAGPSDSQVLGMQDGLQTPGVSSQRLSIGMTPKTLRLPKPGEMLLSVHGSPLGVYKEDNMEAIHESEEG